MSRAIQRTLLPLDTWAAIVGIDPRHFNQVISDARPVTTCEKVWKQYAWQEAQAVSREDVAIAIAQAERAMARQLKYDLLPTWQVDERHKVTQPGAPEVVNVGVQTTQGYPMGFKTDFGQFISGGVDGKTVIEAGAAVVYTDEDGDLYPETATISVATTVTDPQEIALYFAGQNGADGFEIRPLNDPITRLRSVTISGGVVTIVCAREQLVDLDLWNALDPEAVDGEDDTKFVATVDVYRHRNNPEQQVTFLWGPRFGLCDCGSTTCPSCAHSTQGGCLLAADYESGLVRFSPATFDSSDETFTQANFVVGRSPDNVRAWYYAGFRDNRQIAPNLEMSDEFARTVTYLSMTYLTRPLCSCSNVENLVKRMTTDLAEEASTPSASLSFQTNGDELSNPFGSMRGAVQAWRQIREEKLGTAVAL